MELYYLGPKGTYSEFCALKVLDFLGGNYHLHPVSTISKTVDIINKEDDALAVLPIENLIEGIVRQTIDSIYQSEAKIQLQTEIKINHCLVSSGEKSKIKHIVSHPQALAQCSKFILDNFDENIDLINSSSTASALNYIYEQDETYAAICSQYAVKDKKINIHMTNISDSKENATRFVVIGKKELQTGKKSRTSIVFNTKNEPGALLNILEIFRRHNLNLVYIESRPSKRVFGEYNFFSDIDKGYTEIQEALSEVKKECNYYKLLGSYNVI